MTTFSARSKYFLPALFLLLASCQPPLEATPVSERGYQVIDTLPHPNRPFTQGLVIDSGHIIESSGLYEKSYITAYALSAADTPIWKIPVRKDVFAEGLTVFDDKIYLLSWKRGVLKIYDRHSQQQLNTINYSGEGWGLTHNGEQLIRSDGSHRLFFHDPDSFALTATLEVHEDIHKITRLNELEYAQGLIWANIWMQNRIVAIDPTSGQVIYSVDLSKLAQQENHSDANWVLNGIARDEQRDGYWVTGKRWRQLYLIKLDSE
ncbi:MAG TPA: glutaminyl-peptide cyclotransferase [Cellvibrionaceae bacterium]